MRRPRTALLAAALAVVIAVGAGIEGTTRLTGPRWTPDIHPARATPSPPPARSAPAVSGAPARTPSGSVNSDILLVVVWVVVGIVALIAIALVVRWWRNRAPRRRLVHTAQELGAQTLPVPVPEPDPEPPVVRRGVEFALQILDSERDPSDAVVRAWLGLQQSAEDSGVHRRPAETPTEFTSRIMSRAFADDRPIRTLLSLYLRTRFGDHPVTAADVEQARSALAELAASWETAGA